MKLHLCCSCVSIEVDKAKSAVTKVKVERGRDSKPASQKEASDEKISEFFGEAKKSSLRQIQVDPDEDSEFEGTDKGAAYSDSDESDSSDGMLRNTSRNAELDLEDLIQKRQKYVRYYRCGTNLST